MLATTLYVVLARVAYGSSLTSSARLQQHNIVHTDHGEQISMVDRGVFGMFASLLVEQNSGSSKAKVGTKSVDDHGATNVR